MRQRERPRPEVSTEILIKADRARRDSPLFAPFIDAIVDGKEIDIEHLKRVEKDIVQKVEETESIANPGALEKEILIKVWRKSLHRKLADPDLRALTRKLYVRKESDGWLISDSKTFGTPGWGGAQMTRDDKLELFLNHDIFSNAKFARVDKYSSSTTGLQSWGYRDLDYYGATSRKKMRNVLKRIREKSGRLHPQPLAVLEIGSGPGIALTESRNNIDSNLQLLGLTAEMEPAALPGVKYIIAPAELLPRTLLNSCDLIISNRAFEYFAFPELALRAALLALAPNGEAHIDYSYENSAFNELGPELQKYLSSLKPSTRIAFKVAERTRKEFETIQFLSKKPNQYFEIIALPYRNSSDVSTYIGAVRIRKLKEISPEKHLEAYESVNGSRKWHP